MKSLAVLCLVLVCLIVLATQIQAGPRIVFDPEQIDSTTGLPVVSKMISLGIGGSGSTLTEKPVPCRLFRGVLEGGTPADSCLYVFVTSSDRDSILLEALVSSYPSEEWSRIEKGEYAPELSSLFKLGSFRKVPIKDRRFSLLIIGPDMEKLTTIVGSGGKIRAIRPGLVEGR